MYCRCTGAVKTSTHHHCIHAGVLRGCINLLQNTYTSNCLLLGGSASHIYICQTPPLAPNAYRLSKIEVNSNSTITQCVRKHLCLCLCVSELADSFCVQKKYAEISSKTENRLCVCVCESISMKKCLCENASV